MIHMDVHMDVHMHSCIASMEMFTQGLAETICLIMNKSLKTGGRINSPNPQLHTTKLKKFVYLLICIFANINYYSYRSCLLV